MNPRFHPPPEMSSPASTAGANSDTPQSYTERQADINIFNRAPARNVHIYDANDPDIVLGGLVLTDGVTTANFYSMVEIVFLFNQDYTLHDESGITVGRDDNPLQPGKYFIVTAGSITVSDEAWLVRTASVSTATNTEDFRHAIRERDRRCVMTGKGARNATVGFWAGLDATHVFPPAYEDHWVNHSYGDWITLQPESGGSINSVQNGMLLTSDLRVLFDSYIVSINPDVCIPIIILRVSSS